jgi:hypothetical protein
MLRWYLKVVVKVAVKVVEIVDDDGFGGDGMVLFKGSQSTVCSD